METLLKISWRNIWRNPKRSMVMVIAIMLGLWAGLFVTSLSLGMLEQRFQTSIGQHISHFQIHHPEFIRDRNVKYGIPQWESLQQMLDEDPRVSAFSGRTLVTGMLASANLTKGVTIIGVFPEQEASTSGLPGNLTEGDFFSEEIRNPILIGQRLAEKTKLQLRSRLVLTFQNAEGELISATFRVAGIFRTANSVYDEQNVYVTQSDLNDYIGQEMIINEVGILAQNLDLTTPLSEKYQQAFPELTVRTWAEISPELSYMQSMAGTMMIIILGIILFALAFGLVNTMLMSVFERTHELGMLMAIGMNKKRIFSMILLETSFLTFLGAVLGMMAGALTIKITGNLGIDLAAVGGDSMEDFGFPSLIYPFLEVDLFINLTVMVVLTAMVTAIFPSLKALRLNPAEAVRVE